MTTRTRLLLTAMLAAIAVLAWIWWSPSQRWASCWSRDFAYESRIDGLTLSEFKVDKTSSPLLPAAGSLELPSQRFLWLNDVHERGALRVDVDMEWIGAVDGFEILLHLDRTGPPAFWHMPRGLGCQFGGWRGAVSYISPNPVPGNPVAESSTEHPFTAGRRYRLSLEECDGLVRLLVDGDEIARHRLLLPVWDPASDGVALRSWSTVRIHRIIVSRLPPPRLVSPLAIGDALYSTGNHQAAITSYETAARDDARIEPEALARAFLAACQSEHDPDLRQRLLDRIRDRHPRQELTDICNMAEALRLAKDGRWDAALDLGESIISRHPQLPVAIRMLEIGDRRMDSPRRKRLLALVGQDRSTPMVNINNLGIDDLSPLAGKRITRLDAGRNRITDLKPLIGMPMRQLDLSGNPVRDLNPLRGMPLNTLNLKDTETALLAPLRGAPLRDLNLAGTRVTDLSPLRGMPLASVQLTGTRPADLSPLAQSGLKVLEASSCNLSSLDGLAGSQLGNIVISNNPITDIRALRGQPLQRFHAEGCPLSDLGPLVGAPLVDVLLDRTDVTDLAPIVSEHLRVLSINDTPVADLAPLSEISSGPPRLRALYGARTRIRDLAPLRPHPMETIQVPGSQVDGLDGIAFMPFLSRLDLSLTPLTGIESLITPISSIRTIHLAGSKVPPAQLDRLADAIARSDPEDPRVRDLRFSSALISGDRDRLLAQAVPGRRVRLVHVPLEVTFAQANAFAERFHAELPTISSDDDLAAVAKCLGNDPGCWLAPPDPSAPVHLFQAHERPDIPPGSWWHMFRLPEQGPLISPLSQDGRSGLVLAFPDPGKPVH